MKALCWHGKSDVRVDTVPDPKIEDPRDVLVRITATGICGSDLHLYDGDMPTMEPGDVIGHEPMGVVEQAGKSVTRLKPGDRVVVPFTISCGTCWFCERELYSLCDNSNPCASSSRTWFHSIAAPRPTRCFATRKTSASRLCSSLDRP